MSKDELVKQLEDWCHRAEESGIEVLAKFLPQTALLCLAKQNIVNKKPAAGGFFLQHFDTLLSICLDYRPY